MFQIHAATGLNMVTELIDVIGVEFATLAESGPSEREVSRAKAQLKAGLLMSLESSGARAEQMARHLLVHGRLLPAEELVAKVEDVTADSVRSLMQKLALSAPSVAVVGAGKKSAAHAKHAVSVLGSGGGLRVVAGTSARH